MNPIKKIVRKMIFGYRADQESYIRYLKMKGVKVGDNLEIFMPTHTYIDCLNPHLLEIGSNVSITGPTTILTHDYSVCVTKKYYHGEILGNQKKTIIGNNVFIGWSACILPGVRVGDNTIIGAYSVISGRLEPGYVYAGNPAKKLYSIEEYYKKRKSKQVEEAVDIYKNYVDTFGKEPMRDIYHEYFFLFAGNNVPLSEIPELFEKKFYDHGNYEESMKCFMKNQPLFKSYEDFTEYARKQTNREEER